MRKLLTETKNGVKVYFNDDFINHMMAHRDVCMSDVERAVEKIVYEPTFFIGAVEINGFHGNAVTHCLPIEEGDETVLITRPNRKGPTRFFKDTNKKPVPTNKIVVGLCTDKDGDTYIFTSWYGDLAKKEPWDKGIKTEEERKECEEFWNTHALIQEKEMKSIPDDLFNRLESIFNYYESYHEKMKTYYDIVDEDEDMEYPESPMLYFKEDLRKALVDYNIAEYNPISPSYVYYYNDRKIGLSTYGGEILDIWIEKYPGEFWIENINNSYKDA